MRKFLLAALLLAAPALQNAAQAQTPPSVAVQNAWARATPPAAKTGAVFLTIVDHGAPDRVIAFATPVADMAQLHETIMQGNVMQMRQVDGLAVTAQTPVTLGPGGYHVMLMGLKTPLQPGHSFPLSVTFEKAGTIQTSVTVQPIGATAPGSDQGHSMEGHSMDMTMPMSPHTK